MRSFKIFLIVIGVLLLTAGGVMLAVSWKDGSFKVEETITNTHNIEQDFDGVKIDVSVSNVEFKLASDNKCVVECVETENFKHSVSVVENKLVVKENDDRKWYNRYFLNWTTKRSVTITLPKNAYNDFEIILATGDIKLEQEIKVNTLKVETSTGDMYLSNIATDALNLRASTGDIKGENLEVYGDVATRTSTGHVNFNGLTCKNFRHESTTGKIVLSGVVVDEKMSIETSTGDVKFNSCDAAEIEVSTSTGDVTGSLLTGKRFETKTSTGDVDVPRTDGGLCTIKTSTGDIIITIVNK